MYFLYIIIFLFLIAHSVNSSPEVTFQIAFVYPKEFTHSLTHIQSLSTLLKCTTTMRRQSFWGIWRKEVYYIEVNLVYTQWQSRLFCLLRSNSTQSGESLWVGWDPHCYGVRGWPWRFSLLRLKWIMVTITWNSSFSIPSNRVQELNLFNIPSVAQTT
jgi:hypothetical protein